MTLRRPVLVLLTAILLSGCSTVDYMPSSMCSASAASVKFLKDFPPKGTYKVCGSLLVKGSQVVDATDHRGLLAQEARAAGANAVVIVTELVDGFSWAEGPTRKSTAVAIQISR